ncbi:MAG: hypothetical protein LBJ24_01665 [Treponema sp.]|jgi:hypothetical protein|nr:hypothetical protein [Treponema sp.]
MELDLFEKVKEGILANEAARIRGAAKAELAAWEEDFERQTEIRVLKKILAQRVSGIRCGGLIESMAEYYADGPHPLFSFTEKCRGAIPIKGCLEEVRRDYKRLIAQAGEGGEA